MKNNPVQHMTRSQALNNNEIEVETLTSWDDSFSKLENKIKHFINGFPIDQKPHIATFGKCAVNAFIGSKSKYPEDFYRAYVLAINLLYELYFESYFGMQDECINRLEVILKNYFMAYPVNKDTQREVVKCMHDILYDRLETANHKIRKPKKGISALVQEKFKNWGIPICEYNKVNLEYIRLQAAEIDTMSDMYSLIYPIRFQ